LNQLHVDWALIFGPAVVAAIVAAIVTYFINERKVAADIDLAEKKYKFDVSLAERKLHLDRSLADWKRRTELAEKTLADFYKARAIFDNARTPISFQGEGGTRPRSEYEAEAEAKLSDTYYAPLERLNNERQFLSDLHAKSFQFMALFGNDAGEHFQVFVRAYNRVAGSTHMLLSSQRDGYEQALRRKLEADIGWTIDEANDEIRQKINAAVQAMEGICRPVLESHPQ